MNRKLTLVAAAVAAVGLSVTSYAATITFSQTLNPVQPTSVPAGETQADVDLAVPSGYTLFGATNFGVTTDTTVTLSAAAGGTVINFTAPGSVATVSTNTKGSGAFSVAGDDTGNANFNTVLGTYAYDGNPQIITLLGLTAGNTYQVSLFGLDDRTGGISSRTIHFYDPVTTANTSPTITEGNNQFVVATFTADASTQQIALNGVNNVGRDNINALVIYQATPEPASLGLLGIGSLGLLTRRRKQNG